MMKRVMLRRSASKQVYAIVAFLAVLTSTFLTMPSHAQLLGQAQGQAMKKAIAHAIDQGQASFWLDANMARELNASMARPEHERIRLAIERTKVFNPHCARLKFVFKNAAELALFDLSMNMCRDGTPPLEGVDWSTPITDGEASVVPKLIQK